MISFFMRQTLVVNWEVTGTSERQKENRENYH